MTCQVGRTPPSKIWHSFTKHTPPKTPNLGNQMSSISREMRWLGRARQTLAEKFLATTDRRYLCWLTIVDDSDTVNVWLCGDPSTVHANIASLPFVMTLLEIPPTRKQQSRPIPSGLPHLLFPLPHKMRWRLIKSFLLHPSHVMHWKAS